MKVIAYLHTHWDREWYRTFEEFRLRFVDVFDDIVLKLERGDFKQFYLDGQTVLIEDLVELHPEKEEVIRQLVEQKKLVIGPWYTLADEFLTSGESLIRNLLFGIEHSRAFGAKDMLGYLPDAFGHSASMPQVLRSFGISNVLLWRGAGSQPSEFSWGSKDGSKVLVTHLVEGYFQDSLSRNDFAGVFSTIDKIKKYNLGDVLLLPIGADHLGAEESLPEKIKALSQESEDTIEVGSVFDYLDSTSGLKDLNYVESELRDCTRNFILPGTFSSRNYLKQQNAFLQWQLQKVEAFLSFSNYFELSKSRKAELDYAWKMLLKNHAHDSICGCSTDAVHREMEVRNAKIAQLLDALKENLLVSLQDKFSGLFAFNSSSFDYDGVVMFRSCQQLSEVDGFQLIQKEYKFPEDILQDIHRVPVAEDMKDVYTYACKLKTLPSLTLAPACTELACDIEASDSTLENEFIKFEILRDGCIQILNKQTQSSYRGIINFSCVNDSGDTYNFSPQIPDAKVLAEFINSTLEKKGPVIASLVLNHKISGMELKTQVLLEARSGTIKFKTEFNNNLKDSLLQVNFALPDPIIETISEDSLGLVSRDFDPNYSLASAGKAQGFQELKTNTAPLQRFVWSQGVGLLSKGLQEYEVAGKELSFTLLRAVGMLSKTNLHSRSIYAGPPISVPEAQCQREIACEYALCFCDDPQELFKLADYYYNPLVVGFSATNVEDIKLSLEVNNPNIYLLAVKEAQDKNGLILRLLNLSQKSQKLAMKGLEVNSLEESTCDSNTNSLELSFEPFELKALRLVQNFE